MDKFQEILDNLKLSLDDPLFLSKIFSAVSKIRKECLARCGDNLNRIAGEDFDDLSKRLDRSNLQESSSVRNIMRTRRIAKLLINDKGEVNTGLLPKLIADLKKHQFSLGPDHQHDALRQGHIIDVLTLLHKDPQILKQFKSISRPYSHKIADQIIRDTLALPANMPITDAHAKRAVLSAWLCYLRQNVGSCFATAPAIVVQAEQPALFLQDINELLSTGRLKRTFGGIEYAVPLSPTWGAGDLRRPIIISQDDTNVLQNIPISPGLLHALEAVKVIDAKKNSKDKIKDLKNLLVKLLQPTVQSQYYTLITPEELLNAILMNHLNLTHKDLADFLNRPRTMIQENLMMQTPHVWKISSSKTENCNTFFTLQEIAQNIFKGIADNALLKSWEFTLASFSETKSEFTRWNLYSSLGVEVEQPGGIGQCLYQVIQQKLETTNRKIQDLQGEYEQVYGQVKFLEGRMKSASTEKEVTWLRVEYQSKLHEFYMLEELRNEENAKSHRFASLYKDLITSFDKLFPEFFQETYDADMHETSVGPYDDSPAGFRLVYKHGRANTSQWTRIKSPQEFVDSLASFFVAVEPQIIHSSEMEGLEREVSECITAIVQHVKTQEFIETAFYRMAIAHKTPIVKNPLQHLEQIEKKPWAYTSGGTMTTLVNCYFRLDHKPTEATRWVETPVELCVFLVDTLKQIPHKVLDQFIQNPSKSLLMSSPTHAFTLKPGFSPFKDAWMTDAFTYTWIRDVLIQPQERFWDAQFLNEEILDFLTQKLVQKVPHNFQPRFKSLFSTWPHRMPPKEFRRYLLENMEQDRGLNVRGKTVLNKDDIDVLLFTALPVFSSIELRSRIEQILKLLPGLNSADFSKIQHAIYSMLPDLPEINLMTSQQLRGICLGLICLVKESTTASINYPALILKAAQNLGFAPPPPILFADTNWVKDWFGFVVNPGTGKLELWRVDPLGAHGHPMTVWDEWLNGSRKDIPWGVYTRPHEYEG